MSKDEWQECVRARDRWLMGFGVGFMVLFTFVLLPAVAFGLGVLHSRLGERWEFKVACGIGVGSAFLGALLLARRAPVLAAKMVNLRCCRCGSLFATKSEAWTGIDRCKGCGEPLFEDVAKNEG